MQDQASERKGPGSGRAVVGKEPVAVAARLQSGSGARSAVMISIEIEMYAIIDIAYLLGHDT